MSFMDMSEKERVVLAGLDLKLPILHDKFEHKEAVITFASVAVGIPCFYLVFISIIKAVPIN